jgi:hypothetical protein
VTGGKRFSIQHGDTRGTSAATTTPTDEQAALCRSILCQELMKVSSLLASDKDGDGRKLIEQSKQSLMGVSSRLQLTLLALGMTSRELAVMVKKF